MSDRKEYLDFLELPDTATEPVIRERVDTKEKIFRQLLQNAPNEYLRQIHLKNIDRLSSIRIFFHLHTNIAATPAPREVPNEILASSSFVKGWLILHMENTPGQSFPLYSGDNFIGRISNQKVNQILLENDIYVSRLHAVITVTHGTFLLTDTKSKNGTYINGKPDRITQPVYLTEGDTVQFGNSRLVLRINNNNVASDILKEVERSEYMKTVVISVL